MIRRLTDERIRREPAYLSLIDANRALIHELGWDDAGPVEQYNLLVSLGMDAGGAPEARQCEVPA